MRKSPKGYDNKRWIVWLGIAVSAACGETSQGSGGSAALSDSDQNQAGQCGEPGVVVLKAVEAETISADELECPRGGQTGPITVAFDCDEITVISCKDLSNVVVELADGSRQRFEGLSGREAVFGATGAQQGTEIVGVWVKAGANHSGAGPGYGQRFDAPAGNCDSDPPGDTPPGDTPPGDTPPGDDNPPGDDDPPGEQDPPGEDDPPGEQDPPGEDDPPGEQDPPCEVTPPPVQDPPSQEPPSGDDPVVVL